MPVLRLGGKATRPIGANAGGSGRSWSTATVSRGAGRSPRPTITIRSCWSRPRLPRGPRDPRRDRNDLVGPRLDSGLTSDRLAERGITDAIIARKRKTSAPTPAVTAQAGHSMGRHCSVERTNSWLSNFGQMRRKTDADAPTRSLSNPWPSRFSSSPNSSTGETAGHRPSHLSAEPLSHVQAWVVARRLADLKHNNP